MSQIDGVVIALVTDVNDPTGQGRIKVRFPWMSDSEVGDNHQSDWIRIAAGMGGNNRGTFFMPEVNDEALVSFEHGNACFPYVVGFLWNGRDHPPSDHVRLRRIQSVNGHRISFIDSTESNGSKGALVIEDAHGNTISMSNGKMAIKCVGILEIDAPMVIINERVVSPLPDPI
jgi:uncharacterized protein involved in type VI secretion and phage assembly